MTSSHLSSNTGYNPFRFSGRLRKLLYGENYEYGKLIDVYEICIEMWKYIKKVGEPDLELEKNYQLWLLNTKIEIYNHSVLPDLRIELLNAYNESLHVNMMFVQWMPGVHMQFSSRIRKVIHTLLCINSWNTKTNQPYHPESCMWMLPLELMYLIFQTYCRLTQTIKIIDEELPDTLTSYFNRKYTY